MVTLLAANATRSGCCTPLAVHSRNVKETKLNWFHLALISLSVILPWLVLREHLFIDLKASELTELTILGQYNIMLRQFMSFGLVLLSCCISPVFFFSGLILLGVGVPAWIIRETLQERLEHESKQVEKQLHQLEIKEIKNKEAQATREREISLRNILQTRIEGCFPQGVCEIQQNTAMGNLWYDFIIHFSTGISSDILVKVKYTKGSKNIKLLELYFKLLVYELNKHQGRNLASRAVAIVLHEGLSKGDLRFWEKNPIPFLRRSDVDFQDLSEQEISNLTCDEFLRVFFPSGEYPWLRSEPKPLQV